MKIPDCPFDVYHSGFEKLEAYCRQMADCAPDCVRLSSIGNSRAGRPLLLLTVTDFASGAPESKSALLIFANIHCHELSGPLAALRTVQRLANERPACLKDTVFYILPRINPDGVEEVLNVGGFVRSRWEYSHRGNTLLRKDLDGDGMVHDMLKECPWGSKCIDPKDPTHLVNRTIDSKGPFYQFYWEGVMDKWDGDIHEPEEWEGRMLDWNRNWPVGWEATRPERGDFPCNEPEMYALATFICEHRNIFGALSYHNGWGSILGCKNVNKKDYGFCRSLFEYASHAIGYPVQYDGSLTMKDERPANVIYTGQFDDYAYHCLGLVALTIELGTMENSAGLKTEDIITHSSMEDYIRGPAVLKFQEDHPELPRKAFYEWKKFQHPQLGEVLLGGGDCAGLASPAPEHLARVCDGAYDFILEFVRRKPQMSLVEVKKAQIAPGVIRLRLRIQNTSDLPTYVMEPGSRVAWRKKPYAELRLPEGAECLSQKFHARLEHFAPWEDRVLEWFVRVPENISAPAVLYLEAGAAGTFEFPIEFS